MSGKVQRQRGAALLVSLVLLLIMTVLAISSMQGTVLQEGMVSAQRDAQIAIEGAEQALRDAENLLATTVPTFNNSNGLYSSSGPAPVGEDLYKPSSWTNNNSIAATMPKIGSENLLAEAPRYFVQMLDSAAISANGGLDLNVQNYTNDSGEVERQVFRIVARSLGKTGQTPRIVEAYYAREL